MRQKRGDSLKPINFILLMILVIILGFGAYCYLGSALQPTVTCVSAAASDYPDAFDSICSVIERGSAPQTFSEDIPDDAANYSLLDISVTLRNRGVFDAEWLNITLEGIPGDIAVYSLTGNGTDIAARSTGQINLKLITCADVNAARNLSIQYYVYGISRTVTVKIEGQG